MLADILSVVGVFQGSLLPIGINPFWKVSMKNQPASFYRSTATGYSDAIKRKGKFLTYTFSSVLFSNASAILSSLMTSKPLLTD